MTKLNLNLINVESTGGGGDDLLPAGQYTAKVVATSLHETTNGHGLRVTFNVVGGDHEGGQFSDFLNIINSSEKAQKIAQGKVKKIMELGGHPNPGALQDSDELHGLVVGVKLVQEPNYKDPQYTDNVVKGYSAPTLEHKSIGAAVTKVQEVFPNATVEVAPAATRAKLPWE